MGWSLVGLLWFFGYIIKGNNYEVFNSKNETRLLCTRKKTCNASNRSLLVVVWVGLWLVCCGFLAGSSVDLLISRFGPYVRGYMSKRRATSKNSEIRPATNHDLLPSNFSFG